MSIVDTNPFMSEYDRTQIAGNTLMFGKWTRPHDLHPVDDFG
ncbi:hypothetical protein [Candidatus Magnetominusculus dajiuhuensis]